jgi:UDPglucose 6-dehydrogenase
MQLTDVRTAEMVKYASNAFLATKISFINEMAAICETLGADVDEVARGMGSDPRIGRDFLRAGLGWGGSCFPKDVQSLAHMAATQGTHPQLLRSVLDINTDQRRRVTQKLRSALGRLEGQRVLVLGAAFKPNTDDIRYSPALELAELLLLEGVDVTVYDPVVPEAKVHASYPGLKVATDVYDAVEGAQAIVLATDWPEFRDLDYRRLGERMSHRLLLDARNFLDGDAIEAAGFEYRCVGRPLRERAGAAASHVATAITEADPA